MSKAQELADALDRMDNLLNPEYRLLSVPGDSATAVASRADMALIRAALAASSEQQAAQQDAIKYADQLVDIIDDSDNNAPEHRCYVSGAYESVLNDLRRAVIAARASNGGK